MYSLSALSFAVTSAIYLMHSDRKLSHPTTTVANTINRKMAQTSRVHKRHPLRTYHKNGTTTVFKQEARRTNSCLAIAVFLGIRITF